MFYLTVSLSFFSTSIFLHRIQEVIGRIWCNITLVTVVIVPVLVAHNNRDQKNGETARDISGSVFHDVSESLKQGNYTESDPYRKGLEGSRIGVIPFPRLIRRLVQVNDNCDAGKEEEQQYARRIFRISNKLINGTKKAQKEREEVIMVPSRMVGFFVR